MPEKGLDPIACFLLKERDLGQRKRETGKISEKNELKTHNLCEKPRMD
jgi:hypothetical protein